MNKEQPDNTLVRFNEVATAAREKTRKAEQAWRSWAEATNVTEFKLCQKHGHQRPLDEEQSVRDSNFNRKMTATYARCNKCVEEDQIKLKSQALRDQGVTDDNLLHATFDNWISHSENDRINLQVARDFAATGRGFLIMVGPVGTGKSHLAVAVMRAMACPARFMTQAQLLHKLRATYRDDRAEDIVQRCKSVRLLVLDELGMSSGGRDELPMLHDIFSTRHGSRKPTVITTNVIDDQEFCQIVGDRVADRLRQSGFARLVFSGESMRPKLRKEYQTK